MSLLQQRTYVPRPASHRRRVTYVSHVAQLSGAEIAMARLIEASEAVEATVLLAEDGPLVDALLAVGAAVEVHPLGAAARELRRGELTPGVRQLRAARAVAEYAGRIRDRLVALDPDVVHTNSLKAGFYGSWAARRAGKPVVWHLHDRLTPDYLPRHVVAPARYVATHAPTVLLVPSQVTLDAVGHRPADLRTAVIPNVVPLPNQPVRHRDVVGTVGIVGRLTPWKGQHVFLDAFAQAFGADDEVRAAVIGSAVFGETDYEHELRVQVERLGIADRVEFRGFCDVPEQLETLDVLVHASVLADPLTTVVLEGMAAGLPVVSANAGGHVAHVSDGVDGVLYEPGDSAALAAALRRLASDGELRRSLAEHAHVTAERFSGDAVSTRMLALYDNLAVAR